METVEYKDYSWTMWDTGGKSGLRPLIRHYYQNMKGIIFVVDSTDRDRIDGEQDSAGPPKNYSAKETLHMLLEENELKDAHVLVYANKQDLPNAMTAEEVAERLGLNRMKDRHWYVVPCCGVSGEGLYKGLVTVSWTCPIFTGTLNIKHWKNFM